MPENFTPEAMAGYAAQGLRYLLLAGACAAGVAFVLAVAWFIRFWRTGA